jgi:nucleotide-binding universal stress UspA family protein
MFKNILVATDGSTLSAKAVQRAIDLAETLGARLTAFYASPVYTLQGFGESVAIEPAYSRKMYEARRKEDADKILGAIARKAAAAGVKLTGVHAYSSLPWEAILAAAKKQKCDLIVMASHGRRGVSALLLGSETHKVLTHSTVPVLVIR